MNLNYQWALWYANQGVTVIPIVPGTKRPFVRWRQYQTESPTPEILETWFARDYPHASLGAVLGRSSNLLVVDVDGQEADAVLRERLGELPVAPRVISGSGEPSRYHLYFRPPAFGTKAKSTPWHKKLEFRGDRGLAVLPPSVHKTGGHYQWVPGRGLDEIPLPQLPSQIVEALQACDRLPAPSGIPQDRPVCPPAITGITGATRRFLAGEFANGGHWNDRLFRAACDLCGLGYAEEEATGLLLAGARPWNAEEQDVALRTIRSAFSEPRVPGRDFGDSGAVALAVGDVSIRVVRHFSRRALPPAQTISITRIADAPDRH